MTVSPRTVRRAAAIAIAVVGVIHLALADEYLNETTYLGVLFIAGGVASLYVAVRLWFARDVVAWLLGALAAAGMFVGFILSRTVGLPGFHEAEWEPSGILALLTEAAYLVAMWVWLRRRTRRSVGRGMPQRVAEAAERVLPTPQDAHAEPDGRFASRDSVSWRSS